MPSSHWLHLGRALTEVDGTRCLLSWSATMFEYLMPSLLMRSIDGTLLQASGRAAVQRQMEYANEKHVPWGISEAGYYAFDANMNYQYRAFGVPGLGFKRDLAEDLVIAPYASLLALRVNPHAVVDNITRFIELKMMGQHGLYESVDYTRSRLPLGTLMTSCVHTWRTPGHDPSRHRQPAAWRHEVNRFHADPHIQSIEMLLQEKLPYAVPLAPPQEEEEAPPQRVRKPEPTVQPWRVLMVPPVPDCALPVEWAP